MNIIERVRGIVGGFPKIGELHQDITDSSPGGFALASVGDVLLSEDVIGGGITALMHPSAQLPVLRGLQRYQRF